MVLITLASKSLKRTVTGCVIIKIGFEVYREISFAESAYGSALKW